MSFTPCCPAHCNFQSNFVSVLLQLVQIKSVSQTSVCRSAEWPCYCYSVVDAHVLSVIDVIVVYTFYERCTQPVHGMLSAVVSFLRTSAMLMLHVLAIDWTSVCPSVRPSVCHTLVLYQNG